MRGWLLHRWTPLYLLLLSLGGFVLFLYGFFPLEYQTGRHASRDQLPNFIRDVSIDGQTVYDTEETTAVLMVIDALRYDFVSEETMPYTWALLQNGTACEYVALAEPPTVTMPRIKSPERKREKAQWRRTINFWRDIFAMMTGRVSTFADVALNFGAPAVRGDSVPRAAAAAGRRAALYGDDTWLRLFPGVWADADGTTSFYVSDYTEVDDNVTRHLDRALLADESKRPPFDLVVLHYLGLDHIGHLEGARSARVAPKLREMDDVVRKIFTAMRTWDREGVLMVCGDHGMRDAGGHGGATSDELRVPLLLASTGDLQCPHKERPGPTVAQTDIAPSLAYLLRAPLPADSTGRVLPALLPADARQHLYLLHYNARENADALAAKIGRAALQERECYRQFRRAEDQFAEYLVSGQPGAARQARQSYEQALDEMGRLLAESTVKFDLFAMVLAILVMLAMTGGLFAVTLHAVCGSERAARPHRAPRPAGAAVAFVVVYACVGAGVTLACAVAETASPVCGADATWTPIAAALVAAITYALFVVKAGTEKTIDEDTFKEMNVIDYLLIGGTIAHSLTFVGTSFIEEEHQTWRFLWSTLTLCVLARTGGALVSYVTRRRAGATELQDKPRLREAAESVGSRLLPCWLLLVALHRFLRTLNQTGDRWAFLPDTADWLNEPTNHVYLQALMLTAIAATFLICVWNLRHTNNMFQMNTAITIVATACVLLYWVATGALPAPHPALRSWDPVHIVNVFWGLMAAQVVFETLTFLGAYRRCCRDTICAHAPAYDALAADGDAFVYRRRKEKSEDYESFEQEVVREDTLTADEVKLKFARSLSHVALNALALTLTLLARAHNAPLVPGALATCSLAAACVRRDALPSASRAPAAAARRRRALDALAHALLHHWIGWLFFFYQGNSNSLASVELGAGYVGLREYSPVAVGSRMGVHTYAGPTLAAMSLFCMLAAQHDTWHEYKRSVWLSMSVLSLVRVYSLAVYACIAAGFRHHLFVWSVFSPKLLYDLAATVLATASLLTVAAILALGHATHRAARYFAVRSL